jgi:hypothetical protein
MLGFAAFGNVLVLIVLFFSIYFAFLYFLRESMLFGFWTSLYMESSQILKY